MPPPRGGSIPAFSQGLITPFSGNPQVRVARWYINLKTIEAGSLIQVPAFLVTCKVRSLRSYSGYTSIEESCRTAGQAEQPGWTCAEPASPGGTDAVGDPYPLGDRSRGVRHGRGTMTVGAESPPRLREAWRVQYGRKPGKAPYAPLSGCARSGEANQTIRGGHE